MDGIGALALDLPWLTAAFLLATRLAGLALLTPAFGAASVPPAVRVALVLAAAAITASVTAAPVPPFTDMGSFLAAAVSELALGATMGVAIAVGFAVFSFGAKLLDVQIGFGIGRVFDPVTRQQMPVLSAAFSQLALVFFFLSDGHHALLRGFVASAERFPPGQAWIVEAAAEAVMHQASLAFALGLALVAPVVLCLFLVELGLGVIARNLPQVNMFTLGIPVKVLVGLVALAAWIAGTAPLASRAYGSIFMAWEALLR